MSRILKEITNKAKREAVHNALTNAKGSVSQAAAALELNRTEFYRVCQRLGLTIAHYREESHASALDPATSENPGPGDRPGSGETSYL